MNTNLKISDICSTNMITNRKVVLKILVNVIKKLLILS